MLLLRSFLTLSIATLLWQSAHGVIYDKFDIREIQHVPQYRSVAPAVAIAIANLFLKQNADNTWQIEDVEPASKFLCANEPFSKQPSVGICSGFLISDRLLVTAGHCLVPKGTIENEFHPFCESFSWYLDFNENHGGPANVDHIPHNRIYGCKRVIRADSYDAKYETNGQPTIDFALIELDRPVSSDIKPLTIAKKSVAAGDEVFTVGHPLGLPAKYSGRSKVLKNDDPESFQVNLDTFSGNSGGPVFNKNGEVVGILVAGHPTDTYRVAQGCNRLNRCDKDGLNCKLPPAFPDLSVSNFVQRIESVLKYAPQ